MTFNDIMEALREERNVSPTFYRNRPIILARSIYGATSDPTNDDIRRWSKKTGILVEDLLNDIAMSTANDFLAGRISWGTGDWIANCVLFEGLQSFGLDNPTDNAPPWWGVFLAFDQSELVKDCDTQARHNLNAYFGENLP